MILLYKNGKSKYISDTNDITGIINNNVKYVLLNVGIDDSSRYVPIKPKYIITKLEKCTIKYTIGVISNFIDIIYGTDEEDADIIKIIDNVMTIDTIEKFYSYLFSFSNIDFYNLLSGNMEFSSLPPLDIYELVINIISDKYDNKFTVVKKGSEESNEYNVCEKYFIDDFVKLCKDRFHLFEVSADLNNNSKVLIFNKNKSWSIHHIKNDDESILSSNRVEYFTVVDTVCGSVFMVTPLEYYLFNDITYINFINIIFDSGTYEVNTNQSVEKIIELYNDATLDFIGALELDLGKPMAGLITFISLLKIIVVIHNTFWDNQHDPSKLSNVSQLNISTNDEKMYTLNYTEKDLYNFNIKTFLYDFINIKRRSYYENDKIM